MWTTMVLCRGMNEHQVLNFLCEWIQMPCMEKLSECWSRERPSYLQMVRLLPLQLVAFSWSWPRFTLTGKSSISLAIHTWTFPSHFLQRIIFEENMAMCKAIFLPSGIQMKFFLWRHAPSLQISFCAYIWFQENAKLLSHNYHFLFLSSLIILFWCFQSVSFRVLIRSHSVVEMSILFVQVVVWTLCHLQEWFGSVFASKFKCTVWLTVCSQQLSSLGFRAKLLDAVDVLQQAADLDGASLDVRGQ